MARAMAPKSSGPIWLPSTVTAVRERGGRRLWIDRFEIDVQVVLPPKKEELADSDSIAVNANKDVQRQPAP